MGGVSHLEEALSRYEKIVVDTMIFVYVLEKHPAYFPLAKAVLAHVEAGRAEGVISVVTLTELLTAPAQAGDEGAMRDYELYLLHFPHLAIMPLDTTIARETARIRAETGLPTPDAVILATARVVGADAVITNDKRWRNRLNAPDVLMLT